MKRFLGVILVLAMILTLIPAAAFAAAPSYAISFSGTDWMETSTKLDNTRSYAISYELAFPELATKTAPNSWGDDTWFVIRNEDVDDYFLFELKSYINDRDSYQLLAAVKQYDRSANVWLGENFVWSPDLPEKIESAHIDLSWNAEAHEFSVKVFNNADDALIIDCPLDASCVTEELYSCEAAQVRFFRTYTAAPAISDVTYQYAEESNGWPQEPIELTDNEEWTDELNWLDGSVRADNTRDYIIEYDLSLPLIREAAAGGYYDDVRLVVRNDNDGADEYYIVQVESYLDGSQYKIAVSAQFYNGAAWSDRPYLWSIGFSAIVSDIHMKVEYEAAAGKFTWTATDNVSGMRISKNSFTPNNITDSFKACDSASVRFQRCSKDLAVSDVTIAYEHKDPCEGYADINRNAWYHEAADYVIANGLMGSTRTDALTFEPNTKVSRAMVAAILYRIAAEGEVLDYQKTFTDVPAGKWYTAAVEWCAKNGLCSGRGDGTFDPDGFVTRQELAMFFYNFAKFRGYDMTTLADLSGFPDGDKVPAWAQTALSWCVARKIVGGKGVNGETWLMPKDNAVRSELASILFRFPAE